MIQSPTDDASGTNGMKAILIGLELSTADSFEPYHHRVRDRDNITVSRCRRSGVIVLDSIGQVEDGYYEAKGGLEYWPAPDRAKALRATEADDRRRAAMIRELLPGRRWLDVGTGLGGVLDLAGSTADGVAAVEPQPGPRSLLDGLGYRTYASIADVPDAAFDLITLFHVYEHIPDPLGFLQVLRRKVAPGGQLCIEVPHAHDALLDLYGSETFREFTLWSEHLILHTRESLRRFVKAAGFAICRIEGIQRYPLANHLHWLAKGRPGGHHVWSELCREDLDRSYARLLADLDRTDTLLAWATL